MAGIVNPARRSEYRAELHALQGVERVSGIDYAFGTLLGAATERAADEIRRTLVVSDVSKRFGQTAALSNVTLCINPGTVVALMGANGAGKTTLLRMLAGEEAVYRGKITFGESKVGAEMPMALRTNRSPVAATSTNPAMRRLPPGMVVLRGQGGLIEHFTVAENIAFGQSQGWLVHRKLERTRAKAALEQVRSTVDPATLATNLSPSERIQTLLAREVANGRAELVILDEPTAAMSDNQAQAVFDSIAAVRRHGLGVIFVSHRIDQVFRVADRIAVLVDGRLALDERIEDTDPATILDTINGSVAA